MSPRPTNVHCTCSAGYGENHAFDCESRPVVRNLMALQRAAYAAGARSSDEARALMIDRGWIADGTATDNGRAVAREWRKTR